MGVILGKPKQSKHDFGKGPAMQLRFTEKSIKVKLNTEALALIGSNISSRMLIPIYITKAAVHFVSNLVAFEYEDNQQSKKLPAGKISKSGIVTNNDLMPLLPAFADENGIIELEQLKEEDRFGIHTSDSGLVQMKAKELADIISDTYDITIKSFVVFEIQDKLLEEIVKIDEEFLPNAA